MKVKSLTLRSFRGIDDLTLDFAPNVTVLIGNNGVGKSSILDALAISFTQFVEKLSEVGMEISQKFQYSDIINSFTQSTLQMSVDCLGEQTWIATRDRFTDESTFSAAEGSIPPEEVASSFLRNLLNNHRANLPLIVYYPVSRGVTSISLESSLNFLEEQAGSAQTLAYDHSLPAGQSSFSDFFQWFKIREDLENEVRLEEDSSYRDHQLKAVRDAIYSFSPGFSNLRVRRSPLRMIVEKFGELVVNQLSDGEKGLLAMVGDLARRLAIANPGLLDPLQGEGVVLIDEIELHLHPEWQRRIIPSLTQTFPNCQFIITTHSPQILGEIQNGIVYRLRSSPKGIVAEKMQTYGRDSNQILEDIMDVSERSPTFKNDLRRLFRLIEDGKLDEAKRLQQELENSIQYDEPEFAKSDALIRRKEVLGR
ncbi:AAA family ATPase [Phormidesmis priestleyi]|uniref:AAA family ATPase n=1 Tax=Phormidesmis priestleyi TaxID=268141 RepID=UPI00083AC7B7|nr:AAA family ATPase [Phormidesmis priestleyi]